MQDLIWIIFETGFLISLIKPVELGHGSHPRFGLPFD